MVNKKKVGMLFCTVLLAAMLAGGCGTDAKDTVTEAPRQTESQPAATEGGSMETQPATPDTEAPQTEASEEELPETDAADTEEYIDNPAAEAGEGDTNGFYDDAGTWITVYKNSSGQWVDESGMIYQFGDDGVTDENGVFYPY